MTHTGLPGLIQDLGSLSRAPIWQQHRPRSKYFSSYFTLRNQYFKSWIRCLDSTSTPLAPALRRPADRRNTVPQPLTHSDLTVDPALATFVEESLDQSGLTPEEFWSGVSEIIHDLGPKNAELLRVRDDLQRQIDEFHRARPGIPDRAEYREFLAEIGYLEPEPDTCAVTTTGVDPEIAALAGPQLVVPLLNARFALNAVNARWGSLYDALYGTDAIDQTGDLAPGAEYNAERGAAVITFGRDMLDSVAPLARGSHADASAYTVSEGALRVVFGRDETTTLVDPQAFAGYRGEEGAPTAVLLRHHGLHLEIVIDPAGRIGRTDRAGVEDILVESALTSIMDLEDSVAAVDAADKVLGYRNWRGLMDGSLAETVSKGGRSFTRTLNPDRQYTAPGGEPLVLPGRSTLFVRNVGHLMRTDAVRDRAGEETFEGILDAIMTVLGSLHDLRGKSAGGNSRTGSIYIVKPKMHGPAEVTFAVELFERVERLYGLPAKTVKIGIMDEERRTSLNLAACIQAASDRVVFINTGFLDRTGDEIHTSLYAGPMLPKGDIRTQPWLGIYEERNVAIGVASAGSTGARRSARGCGRCPTSCTTCSNRRSDMCGPALRPPGCPPPPPPRCTPCTTTSSTRSRRVGAAAAADRQPRHAAAGAPRARR